MQAVVEMQRSATGGDMKQLTSSRGEKAQQVEWTWDDADRTARSEPNGTGRGSHETQQAWKQQHASMVI